MTQDLTSGCRLPNTNATTIHPLDASSAGFQGVTASMKEDEIPDIDDVAVETAKRRAEELAEGKVPGIPAAEVMRRARERLK